MLCCSYVFVLQVNDSEYGLGSSVFSKNYPRAERIGRRIRSGMCNINDFGVNYLCQSLPFGGVKVSVDIRTIMNSSHLTCYFVDLWL